MYTATADTKVEYLSYDLEMYYYQYAKDDLGTCQAGKQQVYLSGTNLLTDYDQICGYSIYIQNLGSKKQKFNVYVKNAMLCYSKHLGLVIIAMISVTFF